MVLASVVVFLLAFTAQVAFGWHIPAGQPDGVYSVQALPNGTELHNRIGDLPSWASLAQTPNSTIPNGNSSFPDADWAANCYPEEGLQDLDHRTCDLANAGLDKQCGAGAPVGNGHSFYTISECVVAYFCHFWSTYGEDAFCYARERREVSALITKECGRYKPGSAWRTVYPDTENVQPWPPWRTYDVSYGYESYCTAKGHNFCGWGAKKE